MRDIVREIPCKGALWWEGIWIPRSKLLCQACNRAAVLTNSCKADFETSISINVKSNKKRHDACANSHAKHHELSTTVTKEYGTHITSSMDSATCFVKYFVLVCRPNDLTVLHFTQQIHMMQPIIITANLVASTLLKPIPHKLASPYGLHSQP